jgi:dihydroorotase
MKKSIVFIGLFFITILVNTQTVHVQVYDIVINGGRVIDPATHLDAIRNIGVKDGKIAVITSQKIEGKQTIEVKGLVVSPGFIDIHVHGRTNTEQSYQLHDGLTTTLELEWGAEHIKDWYAARKGKALINFGASVCWPYERFKTLPKYQSSTSVFEAHAKQGVNQLDDLFNAIGPSYTDSLDLKQLDATDANMLQALEEGAIGIGAPIGYLKYTAPNEFYRVFQFAAKHKSIVFSHVREPNMHGVEEAVANAMITGASLHIVHMNSMALGNINYAFDLLDHANKRGADITTEVYPYTAASTLIQSAIFSDGFQERLGMNYNDIQWVATGERLTKESFDKYRKSGGVAIMHMMKPDWIKHGVSRPGVFIASDGMPYSPLAHPRTAGTFSRVLGKYVREDKALDLITAIAKMSYLPAKRLEAIAPMMKQKGRLQVGADADITIFDPNTITDKASFEKGLANSEGVKYVIVNGTLLLDNGKLIEGIFPGKGIVGALKK